MNSARRRRVPVGLPLLLWIPLFLFTTVVVTASADTYDYEFRPGPYAPKKFKPGPGVMAAGLNLSESTFVGMNLGGANFSGADLRHARFTQVYFQNGGASFKNANLRDAVFDESPEGPNGADELQECDFTDAVINGLRFVNQQGHLSLQQIQSTQSYKLRDLSGCQIVLGEHVQESYSAWKLAVCPAKLDLSGFDLRDAVFVAGDLTECVLTRSILNGTTFMRCKLKQEQIVAARRLRLSADGGPPADIYINRPGGYAAPRAPRDFSDLCFHGMDLTGWNFTDADLRGTRFRHTNLTGVKFTNADIRGAQFHRSTITTEQLESTRTHRDGNLAGIEFHELDLSGINLARHNLTGTRFNGCNLTRADFTDAVITDAYFGLPSGALTVEQIQSTWNYKNGRMEGIHLPWGLRDEIQAKQRSKPGGPG